MLLLSLAGAAQNIHQLVANDLLDVGAGGFQVLTGVEMIGMLVEVLTNGAGHGQAQVRVDVDLADGELSHMTQLLLRHANGARHRAAVSIDHLDVVLRDGRRAVQNDREARKLADNLFQDVEAQLRVGARLELVSAMRGADGDGQGVTAGLGDELLNLFRTGVVRVISSNVHFVLNAG